MSGTYSLSPALSVRHLEPVAPVTGGGGVQPGGIDRTLERLLDARARVQHATASYLGARADSLSRIETALAEPGESGIAAALAAYQAGWHDVANNPGDTTARTRLLARAETLRGAIARQDRAVRTEWSDQRSRLDALGDEVNQVASELAALNVGLRGAYVGGARAGVLLDRRDRLTMRLAELTGSEVTVSTDTTVDATVAGQPLVTGDGTATVTVTGATRLADAACDPVLVSVGGVALTLDGGEVGGTRAAIDSDLVGYLARLDAFVATLVGRTNTQHALGSDLDGNRGTAFFAGTTAGTLTVAVNDPAAIAAADPAKGRLDGSNAITLGGLDLGAASYRALVTGLGVTVCSAVRGAATQAVLAAQADAAREALSGSCSDEDLVSLLAAQRGYEGASRLLATIASVLDTLTNRTGLLR